LADSSPTANVLAIAGAASGAPAWAVAPAAGASTRAMPKMSTEIWPSRRKSCTTLSCTGSRLTNGSAVLAPGNRCDRTLPFFAAGSFESTSGMWQSAHFGGCGG
jgi:hypothetical protein